MTNRETSWRWRLLYDARTALASEPEQQIAGLGGAHPDELALDFDNAKGVVATLQSEGVVFSDDSIDVLRTLDAELDLMSGPDNHALWTTDALRRSDRWALVRQLAREAITSLPPSP